jgi:hypothetical protein
LPGAPWTSHEWGFALLAYAAYRLGGFVALVHLQQVLVGLVFALVYARMRRELAPQRRALAVPLILLGVLAAHNPLFIMRAALVSSLCLALLSWLLARLYAHGLRRTEIAIALLFVVWANMHVGVVFGLAVLGLHVAQSAFDAVRDSAPRRLGAIAHGHSARRARLLVGCAALTLLNANGLKLWTFPFELNHVLYHSGVHWDLGHYGAPLVSAYPGFYALLALCLATCLPLRRLLACIGSRRAPSLAQALCTLLFLALSLRSSRFIPDFVIFALPWCAARWGGAFADVPSSSGRAWLSGPLAHACGAGLVIAAALVMRPAFPRTPVAERFPAAAVNFMQREHIEGRMFNPENYGGYLGFRLHVPVYWDGRNDVFAPIAKEFAFRSRFFSLVDRHALDMLVLDATYYGHFREELAQQRARFALVYVDDHVAVYVKRVPKWSDLIARWEYTLLQPFGLPGDAAVKRLAAEPALMQRAELEASHLTAQDPGAFAGWFVRGALADARRDPQAAYAFFKHAVSVSPDPRAMYRLAVLARTLGHDQEARALVVDALARARE